MKTVKIIMLTMAVATTFCCKAKTRVENTPQTEAPIQVVTQIRSAISSYVNADDYLKGTTEADMDVLIDFILVSKQDMTLTFFDALHDTMTTYPIACGKNYGTKQKKGDMRTPEGVFTISQIQNSSSWTHDFGDGKGQIAGAYGPFFIRLATPPFTGIGIHGTHDNSSLGKRVTEGCIRLQNENVKALRVKVEIGDKVIITPSERDLQ